MDDTTGQDSTGQDSDPQQGGTSGSAAHASDEQLMLAIATGDRDALAELYRRHARMMAGVARRALERFGQVGDEAEDAVQEVMLHVLTHHAETFVPGRAPVAAWLNVATKFAARNVGRTNHHAEYIPRTVALTEDLYTALPQFVAPDVLGDGLERRRSDAQRDAEHAIAAELVAALPHDLRETADLIYLQGHSRAETAALMGIAYGTVKSRIRRLRAALVAAAGPPDEPGEGGGDRPRSE